jgi:hypothetical protein
LKSFSPWWRALSLSTSEKNFFLIQQFIAKMIQASVYMMKNKINDIIFIGKLGLKMLSKQFGNSKSS